MSSRMRNYLIAGILVGALGFSSEIVSALKFQQNIGVNFTFNPSLGLTLSSNDLHIDNLAPGTANDSNVITVNVVTNSVSGYTLNATVGNNSTYNTRNLLHTNSNISDNFSSIDYTDTPTISSNANLASDKWAFSFSTDGGSTWANYNGLPLYSDTTNIATLKHTTGPVTNALGDDTHFKIAAKASDTKPTGDYKNVINFMLVAAPIPVSLEMAYESSGATKVNGYYRLQDMTSSICNLVEAEDSELQVVDARDDKVYWIAKLADGKCWMTQNLDLNLDTNTTLTHADTDLGWGDVIDTTAEWTPDNSTTVLPSYVSRRGDAFYWAHDDVWSQELYSVTPRSIDPGDLYWSGNLISDADRTAWVDSYNNSDCSIDSPDHDIDDCLTYDSVRGYYPANPFTFTHSGVSSGNEHYHIGNYYSVAAAVATNELELDPRQDPNTPMSTSFETSICPAGWTLPDGSSNNNDFRSLLNSYNVDISTAVSSRSLTEAPFYFNVAGKLGYMFGGINDGFAAYGAYYSDTVWDDIYSYGFGYTYSYPGGFVLVIDENASLYFSMATIIRDSSNTLDDMAEGASIRCVAR